MTQSLLARQKGLSQMTLSNYENDKRKIHSSVFNKTWFKIQPEDMTAAENLRMFRKRMGLTIREIAAKMRISNVTYMKMEGGVHPDYLIAS